MIRDIKQRELDAPPDEVSEDATAESIIKFLLLHVDPEPVRLPGGVYLRY